MMAVFTIVCGCGRDAYCFRNEFLSACTAELPGSQGQICCPWRRSLRDDSSRTRATTASTQGRVARPASSATPCAPTRRHPASAVRRESVARPQLGFSAAIRWDEIAGLLTRTRPPNLLLHPRAKSPIRAEPRPVPSDHRVWFDDDERIGPPGPDSADRRALSETVGEERTEGRRRVRRTVGASWRAAQSRLPGGYFDARSIRGRIRTRTRSLGVGCDRPTGIKSEVSE
jgi:hypothetical protein